MALILVGLAVVWVVGPIIIGRRWGLGWAISAVVNSLILAAPSGLLGLASCTYARYGVFPPKAPGDLGPQFGWALLGFYLLVFGGICCAALGPIGTFLYLRHRDCHRPVGRCANCGYDLRGLLAPRCPECGTSFDRAEIPVAGAATPFSPDDGGGPQTPRARR